MPSCVTCGSRYYLSPYNNTNKCDSCIDLDCTFDSEDQVDIDHLVNPSGKTKAKIYDAYDDTDDQS